jgi:hypothetical protein
MTRPRPARWLAILSLSLTLGLASAPGPALAQEEPPADGADKKSERPFDGYLATAALAGFALFCIAKTARR